MGVAQPWSWEGRAGRGTWSRASPANVNPGGISISALGQWHSAAHRFPPPANPRGGPWHAHPQAIQSVAGWPPRQPGSGATAATPQSIAAPGTRRLRAPRSPRCRAPQAELSSGRAPQCRASLTAAAHSVPRFAHIRGQLSAALRSPPRSTQCRARLRGPPNSGRGRTRRHRDGRSLLSGGELHMWQAGGGIAAVSCLGPRREPGVWAPRPCSGPCCGSACRSRAGGSRPRVWAQVYVVGPRRGLTVGIRSAGSGPHCGSRARGLGP